VTLILIGEKVIFVLLIAGLDCLLLRDVNR